MQCGEWSSGFSEGVWLAYSVLFMTMSFSVFYEMHGTFFNLMFSAFFHRINIIMNDFARLNVAFFLLNELGLFSIISI